MYIVVVILTIIVALLLIGIVLIQKSKGGGLSSQFGNAGSVMGVRQTNSFLEKTTWTLAGLILVLSVASAYLMPQPGAENELRATKAQATEAPAATPGNQFATDAVPAPVAPAATPAEEAGE